METNDKKVFKGEPDLIAENSGYACCLALFLVMIVACVAIYGLYKILF